MNIKKEIIKRNKTQINKGRITDIKYGRVCMHTEKEKDSFKSHNHIVGHMVKNITKGYEIRENDKINFTGETRIEGKLKTDMELSHERCFLNPAITLAEQSNAGVSGLEKEMKLSGFKVMTRVEAGLQANVDAGAEGVFHVSSKLCEFGFKLADRIELGTYEGVNLSASTQRNSNVNLSIKLEQGPQFGGAIGAGIMITRESIHGRLELDGNFGIFGTDLRASFTLQYEDIKHALENISNAIVAGPLGRAASMVFHRSQSEKEDKNSLQGKEVSQKEDKKTPDLQGENNSLQEKKSTDKASGHQKFTWQLLNFDD